MPTTLRIALFAGLLALMSNLAVIGFIYYRTHDEAVATVHRQVVEQGKVLADVYRSGGKTALDDAIEDTLTYADPQSAVALLEPTGVRSWAISPTVPPASCRCGKATRTRLVRCAGRRPRSEAAFAVHHLPTGQWLVSGRIAGEGLALRETLERSLLIALIVAVLLGLRLRPDPRPLRRSPDRRHRRGREPDQRARPQSSGCRCPAPATRSTGSASRSTPCSTGSAA